MNINTSVIIQSFQQDIQHKIDIEQKRLSDIQEAMQHAEQFLLENGYEEIKETDDVLVEVMKTIKKMREQIVINNEDIDNIQKSIRSLKNIRNGIDDTIISSLEKKITDIESYIDSTNQKLLTVNECLSILLNLQIVCPVCNGNCNMGVQNNEEKRFSKGPVSSTCSYCDGVGYLNLGRILMNEDIMDADFPVIKNNVKKIPTPATDKLQSLQKQSSNKYIINRQ